MNAEVAQHIERVVFDAAFIVHESLYYGPVNDFSEEQWNALRDPLYRPRLPIRGGSRVLLRDAMAQRIELLRYYESVIRTATGRGKALEPAAPEFWLRIVFLSGDQELASGAWHDVLEQALSVLDAVAAPSDGEIYYDIDQGWELRIIGEGARITVRQADPDSGETDACFWTDRDALAGQARTASRDLRAMVAWLTSQLGRNYWSYAPLSAR
jgi:hypothetical protein